MKTIIGRRFMNVCVVHPSSFLPSPPLQRRRGSPLGIIRRISSRSRPFASKDLFLRVLSPVAAGTVASSRPPARSFSPNVEAACVDILQGISEKPILARDSLGELF